MIPPQLIAEVLTHIIAFLLLFWVLKALAWRPVTRLLDERNNLIREKIESAEQKELQAQELHQQYQEMIDRIDDEARQRLNEAIENGRRISAEITEKARAEARDIKDKAERSVRLEIDQARIDLKNRLIEMTLQATERLLREKLDDARHRELVARFVEEVEARKA